jgi:hypothetical protein
MQHTTTQPRIAAISQQPVINKSVFLIALAVFGVVSIVAGIVNLIPAIIQLSNGSVPGVASTTWIDIAFDLALGGLIMASVGIFIKGRMLSIWLYAGSIVADIFYDVIRGYPLNFLFVLFGIVIVWQLLKFRDELELM